MKTADLFIQNQWLTGQGDYLQDDDPGTGECIWQGHSASLSQVELAVQSAHAALPAWSLLSVEQRLNYLMAWQTILKTKRAELCQVISASVGKPLWEADTEVGAMINKIDISAKAYAERSGTRELNMDGMTSNTRHKPHGVMAVLGPFNFPGHLANGHIIPALLAGNTVVLKQSELAPSVAAKIFECWQMANLPAGVINLLQGDGSVAKQLLQQPIDGVLFTGSYAVGQQILRQFVDRPEVLIALEMGGNNPLVVHQIIDFTAAAYCIIQSAFITAGQRCTCARRLLVTEAIYQPVIEHLVALTQKIQVNHYSAKPEPFMGPVISKRAVEGILQQQTQWENSGAAVLLRAASLKANTGLISPGIIDTSALNRHQDEEIFGPMLQVIRVADLATAIAVANQTRYGLAAGIITDDLNSYQQFWQHARAGIINWNRPLTGAASQAPFGGIGRSGNHRPSAYYAADYCAYPVASLETTTCQLPNTLAPGIQL